MTSSTNNEESELKNFVIENNILEGAVETVNSDKKLGQLILDALNANPDHVSQIEAETGERTTNGEMKDCSIRCALWLKKLGIGANDVIVTCTHNHMDSYIPVLATFFVDAIFNAWENDVTIRSARRFLKQFSPKVIFASEKAADILLEASQLENLKVKLVVFGNHTSLPTLRDIMNNQTKVEIENFTVINVKSTDDLTLITLSSGSTGFPKGVMRSSKALLANLLKRRYPEFKSQIFLWYSTLEWFSCIVYMLMTILTKQTRIIPTYDDVDNLFQIIEKYKVDQVSFPPNLMTFVARSQLSRKYDLKSLNVIIVIGFKPSKHVLEELERNIPTAFIYDLYGTTEIGVIASKTPACKHIESVGLVSTNCRIKFLDLTTGKSLGPNERGEICAKSPAYMLGYYSNPEESKGVCDEDGWYHTGDMGYYNENGEIFILDRIRDIMKFQGHHVSPAEITELLVSHPDIADAVVVALPHENDNAWPVAFCKRVPGSKVSVDELMKLTLVLEDYKQLRGGIHFVEQFIYTPSGKIARAEMERLAREMVNVDNLS